MKTKLLLIFLLLGGICQAQEIPDTIYLKFDGRNITYVQKTNNQSVGIGKWRFANNTPMAILKNKIDSLEKRIARLEQKAIRDSLNSIQWNKFPQLDSIGWHPSSDYYIVPLPNIKRKSR